MPFRPYASLLLYRRIQGNFYLVRIFVSFRYRQIQEITFSSVYVITSIQTNPGLFLFRLYFCVIPIQTNIRNSLPVRMRHYSYTDESREISISSVFLCRSDTDKYKKHSSRTYASLLRYRLIQKNFSFVCINMISTMIILQYFFQIILYSTNIIPITVIHWINMV